MDRKTFIKKSAAALLIAAPAYALMSCGSDDSNDDGPINSGPDCSGTGNNASTISANHGHSLTVTSADVTAGVDKSYNIAGSAGHSHNVTVTAAQFVALGNNEQIQVASTSGNNHNHSVTISCA